MPNNMRPRYSTASRHRDGRLVVSHLGIDAIQVANRKLEEITWRDRATNPAASPPPPVTDMVSVQDLESRTFRLIFLHRLDYRAPRSPTVGNVVAFSKPCHAAVRAEKLQLGTPAHYRRASLKPGIDDRHDGTLTRGGTRWANSAVRAGGVTHADLTLVSPHEPWVYCAAHYRDSSEVHALKLLFAEEYHYTAATGIADPEAFAVWLGIDFALALDKTADVRLHTLEKVGYGRSQYRTRFWEGRAPIDTFVHMYHGPVGYEDRSGRIDRYEQWFDSGSGPKV